MMSKKVSHNGSSNSLTELELLFPDAEVAALEGAFVAMDADDLGFVTKAQILQHLNALRISSLDLHWEDDDAFEQFADFHVTAACTQSHVEQDCYTFEDFQTIVSSLHTHDNLDFIGTRLFHRRDDATAALRTGMKTLWAKSGEILCTQGQKMDALYVLYHGSASGARQTSSGKVQRLVSLAPGQVFGFMEMILDQSSLLTLSMDTDGTVLILPLPLFHDVLRSDSELLWNVSYEILIEVQRMHLFMNAANFSQIGISTTAESPSDGAPDEAAPISKVAALNKDMPPEQIIEAVFGVRDIDLREYRVVLLGANAPLYEKGQRAAAFWVLVDGKLDLPEHLYCKINGASIVGEMGLMTRQDRARDVRCLTNCTLLRVSRKGLESLVQHNIEIMWNLSRPALMRVVGQLARVTVGFEHSVLSSGKELYRAGQPSKHLYILVRGRLRITDADNNPLVDVSKPGECVGETSLLTETPHSHTVFAVRDTELLVLNEEAFETVLQQNPQYHVKRMFRTAQERSVKPEASKFGHKLSRFKSVAVLSTSSQAHVDLFTENLCNSIQQCGQSVRLITGEMIRSRFPAIRKPDDLRFSHGIAYYMANQEESYDVVICLAENNPKSAWTRWLLRQVDMIMVIGYSDEDSQPTLEKGLNLYHSSRKKSPLAEIHLVLVHPPDQVRPEGTAEWLRHRPKVKHHHHIKVDRQVDFLRLARVITGQTVGVVLSGGGARGVAHLGVLRALMELGVPVDAIGGSSMGSQIGGMFAQELPISEMMRRLEDFYVRGYFRALFWDISFFPYVALLTGEAFANRLKRLLGRDIEIEDLWIPFFCVSANLTTRKAHIHRTGPLWQGARASAALPLLLPPMIHEEGILMDGGLMNNLPVDVMRSPMDCDIVIAVDVSTPGSLPPMPYTTHVSGLSVLWDKLTRGNAYSSAVEMLLYLSQIVDEGTRDTREREADIYIRPSVSGAGLLDWDPQVQLQMIQEGHSAAVSAFAKLKVDNLNTWQKCTGIVAYHSRLLQQHKMQSRSPWAWIAAFLGFVLSVLGANYYRHVLIRWKEHFVSWLSMLNITK